ncbi:hypothetical protein HPULCUR_010385 [Helicostylum pulchrum]|uniref:F-box domain-containing protein n=1 Tax=Helicostylum pulchrum TaxID=562976 RepID=A0ABP9YD64_9FUNG
MSSLPHEVLTLIFDYLVVKEILPYEEDFPFWTQLMYAASQGQLSHLKSLPQCSSASLESYIYTALSFKNSLATLELYDDSSCFGPQVARLGAYQTLCDQMDQFEKLETLRLNYVSDKYLSYFDGLIDKCHHLKEVNFNIIVKDIQQPPNDEPESKIHPRPDVRTFECNWGLINVKSQLEYVMYKFPNLETLRVNESETDEDDVVNCSGPTLIKFIQYIMSVSDFYIHMDIKEEDLLNIWTEFRKGKNGSKKLSIACLSLNLPNINQLSFKVYAAKDDDTEPITIHMPHSSLDSLTWLDQSYSMEYFKGTEVYIKLKTDAGTKFYVGIRNMLFEIESDRYLFFSRHTRFDISCKRLKELRIKRNIAPESDANLVF